MEGITRDTLTECKEQLVFSFKRVGHPVALNLDPLSVMKILDGTSETVHPDT